MDILLYTTEQEAVVALAHLETVARQLWAEAGYTVIDEGVVGKNAVTREDVSTAITRRWDTVKAHPDGGYYFISPRSRYPDYADLLISGDYQEVGYTPPPEVME